MSVYVVGILTITDMNDDDDGNVIIADVGRVWNIVLIYIACSKGSHLVLDSLQKRRGGVGCLGDR